MTDQHVRCAVWVREMGASGKGYTYIPVDMQPMGMYAETTCPPAVGDLMSLSGGHDVKLGSYRVVARCWAWPAWGSPAWLAGQRGPIVDIAVERARGLFADDSPEDYPPDDDDEDAR